MESYGKIGKREHETGSLTLAHSEGAFVEIVPKGGRMAGDCRSVSFVLENSMGIW